MSQIKQNLFALPNVNVPLQQGDFVNPTWYLFFNKLSSLGGQNETGVSSIAAGQGLSTDAASNGTITSSGTLYLNLDYYGTTEGTLLFRGPAAWEGLSPGETGQVLTSVGEGPPSWEILPPGVPELSPGQLLANPTSSTALGVSTALSLLMDQVFGSAWGDVVFRGKTGWQILPVPYQSGLRLCSGGPNEDVYWGEPTTPLSKGMATVEIQNGSLVASGICTGPANFVLSSGLGS